MIQNKRIKLISRTGLMAFASLLAGTGIANAGVALVYTVNVTGLPTPNGPPRPGYTAPKFPETIKAWYSGSKARIEQVGGRITIYDTAAGEEYHLDPSTKTYYVQDANGGGRGFGGGGFGGGGSTATLTPTSETKTILSDSSTKYTLAGSLSFGRRGGFGGGGGGFTPPTFGGEVWFSDSLPLPASATSATPEASILALGMRPLARPLSDAVLKIKEIPIAGKVNLSFTRPDFNGGNPTTISIVESFDATDIHTGPIDDALFTPPASYTKVDPPQRGGGGGGRGGWGGGGGGRGGGQGGYGGGGGGGDQGGGPPPDDNGDGNPPPPPPDNGDGGGN